LGKELFIQVRIPLKKKEARFSNTIFSQLFGNSEDEEALEADNSEENGKTKNSTIKYKIL
jgi:hypothetical protein